jgi:hypothetical protein
MARPSEFLDLGIKRYQRYKDPKNLDLGQNFPGSAASKDLLNKQNHTRSV